MPDEVTAISGEGALRQVESTSLDQINAAVCDRINCEESENQDDVASASEIDHEPNTERHPSSQNGQAPTEMLGITTDLSSNQVISQPIQQECPLSSEGQTSFQDVQALDQPVENPVELSNQAIQQPALNLETGHQPCGEGHAPFQNNQFGPLLGVNPVELSNQSSLQTGVHLAAEQPSSELRSSIQNSQTPTQLNEDSVEHACAGGSSSQNALTATQLFESSVELLNQAVSQSVTHLAMQTTIPVAFRMPQPQHSDPLQNEVDRINMEIDQMVNIHEETVSFFLHHSFVEVNNSCFLPLNYLSFVQKKQLKLDCEKEIEEVAAQIRGKYNAKLQDVDAAFVLKKKELEINQKKVTMNKILADAFRSKCMDAKASGAPGMQQGIIIFLGLLHPFFYFFYLGVSLL